MPSGGTTSANHSRKPKQVLVVDGWPGVVVSQPKPVKRKKRWYEGGSVSTNCQAGSNVAYKVSSGTHHWLARGA